MKHVHEFIAVGIDSKVSGIFNRQARTTVAFQCRECGYRAVSTSTHSVDVVSINGKPYFVPKYFFVFSPIELTNKSVRPSVEYAELASGVYVPVKYVSKSVMERLNKLDEEYKEARSRIRGYNNRVGYEEFRESYKKAFDVAVEQAEVLKKELEKSGFEFRAFRRGSDLVVPIFTMSMERGYFVTENIMGFLDVLRGNSKGMDIIDGIRFSFMGKWSLLGVAVFYLVVAGLIEPKEHHIELPDIPRDTTFPVVWRDFVVFVKRDNSTIIAKNAANLLGNHRYVVRYERVGGVDIAVSYAPLHNAVWYRWKSERLTKGVLTEYGRAGLYCRDCNSMIFDVPIERRIPVDIISIDGTLYYVPKAECGSINSVDTVEKDGDLVPDVEYTEISADLYAPKGYIGSETLDRLRSMSREDQVKTLVAELTKIGFKFFIDKILTRGETEVRVIGPEDVESGVVGFSIYREPIGLSGKICYYGKWSLLGKAVLYNLNYN